MMTGQKHDGSKPRTDLLPTAPLFAIADVLGFGAKKYAAHNWRAGLEYQRVYGAILRHLFAWQEGEDLDPETGLNHLAHAGCELLFLLEFVGKPELYSHLDDRYKPTQPSDRVDILLDAQAADRAAKRLLPSTVYRVPSSPNRILGTEDLDADYPQSDKLSS